MYVIHIYSRVTTGIIFWREVCEFRGIATVLWYTIIEFPEEVFSCSHFHKKFQPLKFPAIMCVCEVCECDLEVGDDVRRE